MIQEKDLLRLIENEVIDTDTAERIRRFEATHAATASHHLTGVLYRIGGALVLFALSWIAVWTAEEVGAGVLAPLAAIYAGIFGYIGHRARSGGKPQELGTVCDLILIALVPVFVHGFGAGLGLWVSGEDGLSQRAVRYAHQIPTLLATLYLFRVRTHPFLLVPLVGLGLALLFESVDAISPELLDDGKYLLMGYGAVLCLVASRAMRGLGPRYEETLHGIGCALFFIPFLMEYWEHPLGGLVSLVSALASAVLPSAAYLAFGGLGLFLYVMHLAWELFDGIAYALSLMCIGLVFLYGGSWYSRNQARIRAWITSFSSPPASPTKTGSE